MNTYVDVGHLTKEGQERFARWASERFVRDPRGCLDLDAVSEALDQAALGFTSDDLDSDELQKVFAAGFEPTQPEGMFFRARVRDALGMAFGRVHAQPTRWLIDQIVPERSVSMVVGPSYGLKTWIALSMTKAVAHGQPWLGRHPVGFEYDLIARKPAPLRAGYVNLEMPNEELEKRLGMLGDDGRIGRLTMPPLLPTSDAFWEELESIGVNFLVIDSLSQCNAGLDEKDSRFAEVLNKSRRYVLRTVSPSAVVWVHHSPKDLGTRTLGETVRGHGSIAAALDACFLVERVEKFERIDPTEARASVTCKKMRQALEPDPFVVRLTDAGGVELVDDSASEIDRVLVAIRGTPGASGSALATALHIRKQNVTNAVRALAERGVVECRGKGPSTGWYPIGSG